MTNSNSNVEFKIELNKPNNHVYFEGEEIEGQVIAVVNGLFFSRSICIVMEGECQLCVTDPNSELYVDSNGLQHDTQRYFGRVIKIAMVLGLDLLTWHVHL